MDPNDETQGKSQPMRRLNGAMTPNGASRASGHWL
jgi:hypothetical protein